MSDRNIRWAQVKKASDDKGPYKLYTVETDGKEMDCIGVETYGVQGNAPQDCQALVLVPDGDEGKAVVIILPPPAKRTDQQKEGEVTFINHVKGQTIKHDADGNTRHDAPKDIIMTSGGEIHLN